MNRFLEKLPIVSCQEATRLMSESLERRLNVYEWFSVRLHGAVCAFCQQFERQIKALSQLAHCFGKDPQKSPPLSTQAKQRITDAIDSHS